jgi:hypothetical protein
MANMERRDQDIGRVDAKDLLASGASCWTWNESLVRKEFITRTMQFPHVGDHCVVGLDLLTDMCLCMQYHPPPVIWR